VLLLDGLKHLLVGFNDATASVGQFDATIGATINAGFIAGPSGRTWGMALEGSNHLFAANNFGPIAEYNATTGATINATFISPINHSNGLAFAPSVPEPRTCGLGSCRIGCLGLAASRCPRLDCLTHGKPRLNSGFRSVKPSVCRWSNGKTDKSFWCRPTSTTWTTPRRLSSRDASAITLNAVRASRHSDFAPVRPTLFRPFQSPVSTGCFFAASCGHVKVSDTDISPPEPADRIEPFHSAWAVLEPADAQSQEAFCLRNVRLP